jgi:nitroreductase
VIKLDVNEIIRVRRSIRKYKRKRIEEEKLVRVLEAGRLSPSAVNKQPWHFILITDPEIRNRMKEAYDARWFYEAPVCVDPTISWIRRDGENFWKVDGAIAMQSMVLQATEEGLGTCWIGAFHEAVVRKILEIPPHIRVLVMTPLGYPDEVKEPVTKRKKMEEILHQNKW